MRASESNFDHRHTVGLGNYMGKAFVTGCDGQECGFKTEFMDMATLEWSNGPDYPFAASLVSPTPWYGFERPGQF